MSETLATRPLSTKGSKAARGDYLVMLNHDAVVTVGWLDQLIPLANARATTDGNGEGTTEHTENTEEEMGKERTTNLTNLTNGKVSDEGGMGIGLVEPMSNCAAPPQLVENVPYREVQGMQAFARRWRDEHRGSLRSGFTAAKLAGFCLLM